MADNAGRSADAAYYRDRNPGKEFKPMDGRRKKAAPIIYRQDSTTNLSCNKYYASAQPAVAEVNKPVAVHPKEMMFADVQIPLISDVNVGMVEQIKQLFDRGYKYVRVYRTATLADRVRILIESAVATGKLTEEQVDAVRYHNLVQPEPVADNIVETPVQVVETVTEDPAVEESTATEESTVTEEVAQEEKATDEDVEKLFGTDSDD